MFKLNRRRVTLLITLIGVGLALGGCNMPARSVQPDAETPAPLPVDTATAEPSLEPAAEPQTPVIWDDDGSPDGVIALLYLLKDPRFRVEAITVSCGEAHPELFARNLTRMLARLGRTGIPVAAGRATPLEGDNAFPEAWRAATDDFWGVALPTAEQGDESISAAQLIIDTVRASSEPITILLTGNHTNLAEALRQDPSIAENIAVVEIMGGALDVPGNIASDYPDIPNEVAEWNIWVDPVAAADVFASSIPLRLVPLDATNHVVWTEADAAAWEKSPEGEMAAEILRWMLRSWFPEGVYAWDVVAAADMTGAEFCQHSDLTIRVATQPGDEQGQTIVEPGEPPNASVCLTPDAPAVKEVVREAFQAP